MMNGSYDPETTVPSAFIPAVPPFTGRLKRAAEDGILLGVKWGIVFVVIGGLFLLALGDYAQVRQGALQGAEAFRVIQQAQQQAPQ